MERERFEALVTRAIENLPPEFRSKLENVDIAIEDWANTKTTQSSQTQPS